MKALITISLLLLSLAAPALDITVDDSSAFIKITTASGPIFFRKSQVEIIAVEKSGTSYQVQFAMVGRGMGINTWVYTFSFASQEAATEFAKKVADLCSGK